MDKVETKRSLKKWFNRDTVMKYLPITVLILMIVLFYLWSDGKLLTRSGLRAIFNSAFIMILGSTGFIFTQTQGNMDLSIGGNVAVSCAAAALAAQVNPWLSIPAGIITGSLIGVVNGFLYVKLKIDAFIATVAMNYILSGVVVLLVDYGVLSAPLSLLEWDTMLVKLITLVVVVGAAGIVYTMTPFGKQVKWVGCNENAARQFGIRVDLLKFLPFVILGSLCGLVGFFTLVRSGTASSQTGASMFTDVLNAILLGGVPIAGGASSKFRAVIIGSLTSAVLSLGMTMIGVDAFTRQMVNGILFLVIVAVSFDRRSIAIIN